MAVIGSLISLSGCATKVTRMQPEQIVDISGRWNDTDARLVAEEMITDCLSGEWVSRYNKDAGKDPVVIVGTIVNRTHEHINTDVFVEDLERALINSNKVKFVATRNERDEVREEREDQQLGNTNPETVTKKGMETGASFMLKGSINDVKDETRGKYAVLYQANLEMVDMKTNEKVWLGQKKIKKLVVRPKASI
ncbi:MAG: penicillin-binding protein activator LpoB [Candidatus Omnitrophica bacterium]|nr:penicillin-binding protein activator LpoB [Candidatus Omnitrophota bacterium]